MPCYKPIHGFRGSTGELTFSRVKGTGLPMTVPCGRCIGCRLERSRQWAVRMMHEAQMHDDNCFVTLTYSDEHLPDSGSLDRRAFPLFMKRLRKQYGRVRYFHCGEYGEQSLRPHYHACLFGLDFPDKEYWSVRGENRVWRSPSLERLWPFGNSEIGSLTFDSAAYVARYVTKKVTGDAAKDHYERVNPLTGEIISVEPEYATMSRRPGIGAAWLERFGADVYPSDEVVVNGHSCKPPRFYDERYRQQDPEGFEVLKHSRRLARSREDESPERLAAREVCAEARMSLSPRGL